MSHFKTLLMCCKPKIFILVKMTKTIILRLEIVIFYQVNGDWHLCRCREEARGDIQSSVGLHVARAHKRPETNTHADREHNAEKKSCENFCIEPLLLFFHPSQRGITVLCNARRKQLWAPLEPVKVIQIGAAASNSHSGHAPFHLISSRTQLILLIGVPNWKNLTYWNAPGMETSQRKRIVEKFPKLWVSWLNFDFRLYGAARHWN